MPTTHLQAVLRSFADHFHQPVDVLHPAYKRSYNQTEPKTAADWLRGLNEAGQAAGLTFLNASIDPTSLADLKLSGPILIWVSQPEPTPFMLTGISFGVAQGVLFDADGPRAEQIAVADLAVRLAFREPGESAAPCITALAVPALANVSELGLPYEERMRHESATSHHHGESGHGHATHDAHHVSPLQRFWALLRGEHREISYVYVYAIASGLVGLGIPLAVQTIVQLISSGRLLEPIILLTAFVIFSTFISGFLQIKQAEIVELIQQRLFAKTSFEFALRIPRLRLEAITDTYAPELMNRFMDIVKVQSGIAKILTDFIAAFLQIVFGLMLLAFYHPFFLIFGLVLAVTLFLIFYITGPKGLQYSIEVSKYKYKILHWVEDMSQNLASFKLAGFTTLPYEQMDKHLAGYLTKRAKYFKVIKGQMLASVIFKTLITGSLLVLGYVLLTAREITLGQFVASELVILLVLGSVEKLMMNLTLVYDILTSLDKLGHVTDLPLDRAGGIPFPEASTNSPRGVSIRVKDLSYTYPSQHHPALSEVSFAVAAGDRIIIAGAEGSGRTTLLHLLAGLYDNFTGMLAFDNIAFQDLELYSFRDCIGEYWSSGQIFQGTVYQNIAMGKPRVTPKDVLEALERVNLLDTVNSWPRGLHTQLTSSGKGLPDDVARRIIIARALAEHPRLLVLDDGALRFEGGVSPPWIDRLFDCRDTWTLVLASNNPRLLARCDKVLWLEHGQVQGFDSYTELLKKPNFARRFGRTELTKLAD